MKTFYKIGIIALLVGAIILLVVSIDDEDRPFDKIEISRNSTLNNGTDKIYYDTIFQVGLNLIGLQGLDIQVRPLSDDTKSRFEGDLKAHVVKANGIYYVFIDDVSRRESIEIIAHELIHILQYNSSDLMYENRILIWKGEEFTVDGLSYDNRPWEIEAFSKGSSLANQIKGVLYKD